MCKSCGSNVAPLRSFDVMEGITMQKLYNTGNYKLVRYTGRNFTTTIGSPTGVIVKDGLKNYGRGKTGDILLVHVEDIKKSPAMFTVLKKDTDGYEEGLRKYDITEVEPKSTKEKAVAKAEAIKPETPVKKEVTVEEPEPVEVTKEVVPEQDFKKIDPEEFKDTGGRLLSKDEALPLKEFQDKYGFNHHIQVFAKIRSGELKSFKDEDDKTFIYHFD